MSSLQSDEFVARLTAFLTQGAGGPANISALTPIAGGASRATWAVDAEISGVSEALVLRMDLASSMNPEALSRSQEFELLAAAHAAGVLAPRPRWLDAEGTALGRPFLLMD